MSIALTRSGFSIALPAFAVACFFIGLEVCATTAAPSGPASLTIKRTIKSDRMPLVHRPAQTNPPTTDPPPPRPRRDERPNDRPPPARWMRADGERHWAVAAGRDRWALRFLIGAGR